MVECNKIVLTLEQRHSILTEKKYIRYMEIIDPGTVLTGIVDVTYQEYISYLKTGVSEVYNLDKEEFEYWKFTLCMPQYMEEFKRLSIEKMHQVYILCSYLINLIIIDRVPVRKLSID